MIHYRVLLTATQRRIDNIIRGIRKVRIVVKPRITIIYTSFFATTPRPLPCSLRTAAMMTALFIFSIFHVPKGKRDTVCDYSRFRFITF